MNIFNFLIILFLPAFVSCETPAGHSGVSHDIKESKKRNVFIAEYTVNPNPYKINDSLQITVTEAWLELQWAYGRNEDETTFYPTVNYQLCINTSEKDIQNMYVYWTIGLNGDQYIRPSSNNSLMGDFASLPKDTIEYKVQEGNNLSDNSTKVIIGKFVLVKKKVNN